MKAGYVALAGVLVLAGCSKPDNAPGPGGVTMGEARALDDAAAMLDSRKPPPVEEATAAAQDMPSAQAEAMPAAAPIH
ncbi:hypothetical protein [Novosphingobium sp. 9]|uniref:hypothetical protein n=1 Tax=Novosphingobium sp. 9 TaxID=2025349 RepID=UPI0021B6C3DF|nr:hypothetical protein [Novosphingobium sp. 9]